MSVAANMCWLPTLYTMTHIWLVSIATDGKCTGPPSIQSKPSGALARGPSS